MSFPYGRDAFRSRERRIRSRKRARTRERAFFSWNCLFNFPGPLPLKKRGNRTKRSKNLEQSKKIKIRRTRSSGKRARTRKQQEGRSITSILDPTTRGEQVSSLELSCFPEVWIYWVDEVRNWARQSFRKLLSRVWDNESTKGTERVSKWVRFWNFSSRCLESKDWFHDGSASSVVP